MQKKNNNTKNVNINAILKPKHKITPDGLTSLNQSVNQSILKLEEPSHLVEGCSTH